MDYILNLSKYPEDLLCRIARAIYRHIGAPYQRATGDEWGSVLAGLRDRSSKILYMLAGDISATKPIELDDVRRLAFVHARDGHGELSPESLLETLRRYRERAAMERLNDANAYLSGDVLTQDDRSFLAGLLSAAAVSEGAPDDRSKLEAWLEKRGV